MGTEAGPSRAVCFALSAVFALAFVMLGLAVGHRGEPAAFVSLESALLDRSTLVAWWVTWACYIQVLGPLGVVLLVVAWRVPAWRGRILFSIGAVLVCWLASDRLQHLFARGRPALWVVKHETASSYPSTHAAMAIGFYGLWAWLVARSDLPGRRLAACLLAALTVAILWSRLALGAHYVTDLAGGALLGAAVVLAGAGALRR